MAFTMTFHCGLHLQMLSRVVGNLRCGTASSRINFGGLHRAMSKSVSNHNIDADSNEAVCDDLSQTVELLHPSGSHARPDHSTKKNMSTEHSDLVDCNSGVKIDSKQHKYKHSKHSPANSKRKTDIKTPSQYFKKSWLNHYSNITEETRDTSVHNNLQTESVKANDRLVPRKKIENSFGALSRTINRTSEKVDPRNPNERIDELLPEDKDERRDPRLDIPLTRFGRINKSSFYYTKKIAVLGRQGKIREAIAIFEDWMMVRDRVMPNKRLFVILIGILGRVGYTKKAFDLHTQMKRLGLDPEDRIYTSLFNSCANSPSPAEALIKIEFLLCHMKEMHILPNLITVKAAMKALAVCGDFSRAFSLLDETSRRFQLDGECFSHLLIACISDREAGFRRALQVWQKMALHRVRPDTFAFNLLIRSARDCGLGDPDTFISCFNLESLGNDRSAPLALLDSISFDASLREERPGRLTSGAMESDGKLEVTGHKLKIHSGLQQQDSTTDCASHKAQKIVHSLSGQESGFDSRGLSAGDRVSNVGDELNEHHKHASVTDFHDNLPHAVHDAVVATLEAKERSLSLSMSETNALSATVLNHSKSGDIRRSLYSDLLTGDTSSNVSILEENGCNKISLKDFKFPFGRFALLGGADKFINFMEASKVRPDLKTFAQILACLPNDEWSEFNLLTLMEERGIKPDIDFFNDIMIRRVHRKQKHTVEAVMKLVGKLRLTPNMRTYAALALTCPKEEDAKQLLQDMKQANLEPNSVIMGSLLTASGGRYGSKLYVLKTMESLGIKVTQYNITVIEKSIAETKRRIIEAEKKKDTDSIILSEPFQRSFQYFLRYYKVWLQRNEMEKPRHPWDSFKPPEKKEEKCLNIVG